MVDNINIDWITFGVGFVIGIGCVCLVSDLVFPVKKD